MLIDIRCFGFPLTDAIRRHVEARVESALATSSRQVLRVTVRLDDVNAGRGGIDKRCRVVVALRRDRTFAADAVRENLYDAVDRAARKARVGVGRTLKRSTARERQYPRRPFGAPGLA
jgi:ribosome-associated translation inhibitor RaiA